MSAFYCQLSITQLKMFLLSTVLTKGWIERIIQFEIQTNLHPNKAIYCCLRQNENWENNFCIIFFAKQFDIFFSCKSLIFILCKWYSNCWLYLTLCLIKLLYNKMKSFTKYEVDLWTISIVFNLFLLQFAAYLLIK